VSPPDPSTITLLVLLPLIAWRVVARFRSMIGRQRLGRRRPWIQLAIFSLLLPLFGWAALAHPQRLLWLALGTAAGGALGLAGLRLTSFEATPQGYFYTPSAPLGLVLGLLFVGRIAWRLGQLALADPGAPAGNAEFASSVATLAMPSAEKRTVAVRAMARDASSSSTAASNNASGTSIPTHAAAATTCKTSAVG